MCALPLLAREDLKALNVAYDKTESDLKALHSVGQIVGEVLKQLDVEKCMSTKYCNNSSTGSTLLAACLRNLDVVLSSSMLSVFILVSWLNLLQSSLKHLAVRDTLLEVNHF